MNLTHARLRLLPSNFSRLTKVEVLTLRQNLLRDITPVLTLRTLKELDVYDNELTEIPDLSQLEGLE